MAIASDHSSPDLLSVGKHCAFPDCHQLDFLPFVCKDCGQAYCQEHRTSASHQCLAAQREPDTLLCPLCALAIRCRPGEAPDEAFERWACASMKRGLRIEYGFSHKAEAR